MSGSLTEDYGIGGDEGQGKLGASGLMKISKR